MVPMGEAEFCFNAGQARGPFFDQAVIAFNVAEECRIRHIVPEGLSLVQCLHPMIRVKVAAQYLSVIQTTRGLHVVDLLFKCRNFLLHHVVLQLPDKIDVRDLTEHLLFKLLEDRNDLTLDGGSQILHGAQKVRNLWVEIALAASGEGRCLRRAPMADETDRPRHGIWIVPVAIFWPRPAGLAAQAAPAVRVVSAAAPAGRRADLAVDRHRPCPSAGQMLRPLGQDPSRPSEAWSRRHRR